ncbi:alpha-xenorhabdolysin family binary toxin subunit A [Pseudomonas sp. PSKL.D1]|uniref:alpha-xenorhabdolysin family binary toxin subunit A n=1 Tax=Pseudomonas sp. PSKL.D1 TaxID=3029060 RepID=UPI002380CE13|nr:alpha-xenorhabdolysin family binary toxin subunit A [Pseudomonas sp. PSKL.D1]WDY59050.1 alpha-xenorhabdolysin family binary toxin subunit A [Pseudomonas sp. PSKL.D1]
MGDDVIESSILIEAAEGVMPEHKPYTKLTEEEQVLLVPDQIFRFKENEPAFIFSKENLVSIRRYVKKIRQLPQEEEVSNNVVFPSMGIQAVDVNGFYNNLRSHAGMWDGIENLCKTTGADLQVFAEDLLAEGGAFIDEIKGMESWGVGGSTEPSKDQDLPADEEALFKESVENYLGGLSDNIKDKLEGIRTLKKIIDVFGNDIFNVLEPTATSLSLAIAQNDNSGMLADLEEKIGTLDVEIKQLLDEYNSLVGTSFAGLVFGPIGLLVTGGIYGAQAETVRAQKNEKIAEREELAKSKNLLIVGGGDFDFIRADVEDIKFRLVDVGTAVKNLEDVWVLLESYMTTSLAKAGRVTTQLALKRFVRNFELVIKPWEKIQGVTKNISKLFNEVM